MDILEAISVFYLPVEWINDGLSVEQTERILADRERFNEAQRVVGNPDTYRNLTAQEGHVIALAALDLFDADTNAEIYLPQQILTNLADIVPGSLAGLYSRLLERDLSWDTDSLFREADAVTRDQIIALLEAETKHVYPCEELLCMLAWIGDETVQRKFQQWHLTPPVWCSTLYIPPEDFAKVAGWELTKEGERRNLYFQENYDVIPLTQAKGAAVNVAGPLTVAAMQDETCGWCGRPLMTLFEMDLRDSWMAFLGIQGERLRLPICLNCSFQIGFHEERLFMDVDWSGMALWSPINGECPAHLKIYEEGNIHYVAPFPPPPFILGEARRTPYERGGAHIGGCPDWPQADPDYPTCPMCRQTMLFVGQLDLDQINRLGFEGYLYVFLCRECRKVTTGQQH